jgi:hypothetical protein
VTFPLNLVLCYHKKEQTEENGERTLVLEGSRYSQFVFHKHPAGAQNRRRGKRLESQVFGVPGFAFPLSFSESALPLPR